MSIYWSKVFVVLAIVVSITLIIVFGVKAGVDAGVLAAVVGSLSLALSQMLPAVANAKTTIAPPPMPGTPKASLPTLPLWREPEIPAAPLPSVVLSVAPPPPEREP